MGTLTGPELDRGIRSVIGNMAGADPAYTAEWVGRFPAGQVRDDAAQTLMQNWPRSEPQQAAQWLNSLTAGEGRDKAVAAFVGSVGSSDPGLGWTWAMSIQDPTRLGDALEQAAGNLLRSGAADARTTIQNSGLPADVVQRLLRGN